MKRLARLSVFVIGAALVVTGCGSKAVDETPQVIPPVEQGQVSDNNNQDSEASSGEEVADTDGDEMNEDIKTEDILGAFDSGILIESKVDENVETVGDYTFTTKATYPQLSIEDDARVAALNAKIKSDAESAIVAYNDLYADTTIEIDNFSYAIHDEILSIQYSGLAIVSGSAHPSQLFYTSNIDLETFENVTLSDKFEVNEQFLAFLKSGAFTIVDETQAANFDWSLEDDAILLGELQAADSLSNIGGDGVFSYYKEDRFGISIPVIYALGGHMELETSYDNVQVYFDSLVGETE